MSFLWKDQQLALQNVTFELLVTNGQDVCQALAKKLVDMYISDNAATDVINARLREVCPSLYSCHDEVYSKVKLEEWLLPACFLIKL